VSAKEARKALEVAHELRPHLGHKTCRIPCCTVMLSVGKDKASQHGAMFRVGSGPRGPRFKSARPDHLTLFLSLNCNLNLLTCVGCFGSIREQNRSHSLHGFPLRFTERVGVDHCGFHTCMS
jgi:hypothetical protein